LQFETRHVNNVRDADGRTMSDDPGSKKLYQQLARSIADGIKGGDYPRGRRLPSERDLAEKFRVSRPTVREAMIALEIQGFVESRHGSGVYVTHRASSLDGGADLDIGPFELTEARRAVEGEACALAATSITDAELAELETVLHDLANETTAPTGTPTGAQGDPSGGERADRRFHVLIAQATRNSALVSVVEMLWDLRYRSPLCREMLARARASGDRPRPEEHREIFQALAARDPQGARAAMRDHLTRVIDGLLAATESEAMQRVRQEAEVRRDAYRRRGAI
jgi:GntR family transcriptional repressor for pyruvate dehydrogenase complex